MEDQYGPPWNASDVTDVPWTNGSSAALVPPGTTSWTAAVPPSPETNMLETGLIVPLYVVIFILSVVGNSLVLVTLAQKKRMRTVTNVYLLNLVSFRTARKEMV